MGKELHFYDAIVFKNNGLLINILKIPLAVWLFLVYNAVFER